MALLLAHFWSQFLTDFHKWPFVLKLRTCSFICTYCHDPTMVIMGRNGTETGPKIVDNFDSWHVDWCRLHFAFCMLTTNCIPQPHMLTCLCTIPMAPARVRNSHETNSFHFFFCSPGFRFQKCVHFYHETGRRPTCWTLLTFSKFTILCDTKWVPPMLSITREHIMFINKKT